MLFYTDDPGHPDLLLSLAVLASHAGVFRDEKRAPLKMPAWEAIAVFVQAVFSAGQ